MGRRGRAGRGFMPPPAYCCLLLLCAFWRGAAGTRGILPGTDPINTTDFRTDVRLPAATTQLLKI